MGSAKVSRQYNELGYSFPGKWDIIGIEGTAGVFMFSIIYRMFSCEEI